MKVHEILEEGEGDRDGVEREGETGVEVGRESSVKGMEGVERRNGAKTKSR
jgi:hypothetical protein